MNGEIALRIVLLSPPTGYDFGLQKGSGNTYETVQIQRSSGGDLHFSLSIPIKTKADKPGEPQFSGPFVQGPTGGKFIYIDIGQSAGKLVVISRRLKIPLYTIANNTVQQALNSTLTLVTRINGTAKDGGPNCATPKPFDGWEIDASKPV